MAELVFVRSMPASSFFEPLRVPHRSKRFWIVIILGVAVVLVAPVVQMLLGLPPFPRHVQFTSGAITFALWVAMIWFAVRFGRMAWFAIALFFLCFGLFAMLHS